MACARGEEEFFPYSVAFPLPNTDDVLKKVSLKYVSRYRGGRGSLKDDKVVCRSGTYRLQVA